jgi:hypothetical protein
MNCIVIVNKIETISVLRVTSQKLRARGLQRGKAASHKIPLAILYIDID